MMAAPVSKRARKRAPKRATRGYLNVTVDPHTVDRLDTVAAQSAVSRGRIVDVAILRFVREYLSGSVAFCDEPGCARMRPDEYGGDWRCEEHAGS